MSDVPVRTPRFEPRVFDVALTVLLLAGGLVGLFFYPGAGVDDAVDYLPGDALGVFLVVLTTAPLALRRRAPILAGAVVTLGVLAFLVWNYAVPTATVVMVIATYSAAAYAGFAVSLALVAAMTGASVAYVVRTSGTASDGLVVASIALSLLAFVVVWGVGRVVQARRVYTAELEDRTERLEHARAAEIRAALAEERSRIARELHDVVAHHVSVMTVQAAGAARTLKRDPERSAEALHAIESTGRSALSEMRRIVGVLRGPDAEGSDPDPGVRHGRAAAPGRSPAPGLADVDALLTQVRGAGLPVEFSLDGEPGRLPVGVDLTAYRIVQEALTNTIKHAGPATRASVVIRHAPGQLDLVITDDGRGLAAALDGRRQGHGLLGMRERVALYGGTLSVGPRRGGGFEVRASIPYDPAAV